MPDVEAPEEPERIRRTRKVNCWRKFWLLMWKNMLLQFNHKIEFLCEVIAALILFSVLIILRNQFTIHLVEKQVYKPFEIDNLDAYKETVKHLSPVEMPLPELIYSPKNEFIEQIVSNAANQLQIGWKAVEDKEILMRELKENNYLAGVSFEDYLKELASYPKKLRYSLHMPTDLRSEGTMPVKKNKIFKHFLTDVRGGERLTWLTDKLYIYISDGPRNPDENDGGLPPGYYREGFLAIQHALAIAYIKLTGAVDEIPKVVMQRFPYPAYIHDELLDVLIEILPVIIIAALLLPIFFITMKVCREKEHGVKELLKTLGVQNWIQWLACFTQSLLLILIFIILLTIMLKVPLSRDYGACFNLTDGTALFFILFVYSLTCICFCCLIGILFNKPLWAAITAAIIYALSFLGSEGYSEASLIKRLVMCLDFNMALAYAIILIERHELNGEGLQWKNMFMQATSDDHLSVGIILGVLAIGGTFMMLLCLYLEQLFPGKYGIPRKWNFIFKAKFWHCEWKGNRHVDTETIDISVYMDDNDEDIEDNSDFIESDPLRKTLIIELRQLQKKYGNKTVVHDISMNIFANELTALVGHKGAGKTTTITMMMGMLTPSDGTVHINNLNMVSHDKHIRPILGVCPQINSLFSDLSIRNQLVFFCRLKGLRKADVEEEVDKYLNITDLEEEADMATKRIGVSAQRKLMLCCALCGGSQVVLCDEPTLDMDQHDRYDMWNLLRVEKEGRTIFITTKSMEEAEILADRIAVICYGDLKCYGSPFFLRNLNGSGHQLVCFKGARCRVDKINALLQKHIRKMRPKSVVGEEITYAIPDKYSRAVEEMLRELEDNLSEVRLKGFEIRNVTVEETCTRVKDNYIVHGFRTKHAATSNFDEETELASTILARNLRLVKGGTLALNHWTAMLLKNFMVNIRKKRKLFFKLLLPLFIALFVIHFLARIGTYDDMKPLELDLDTYRDGMIVMDVRRNVDPQSVIGRSAKGYRHHVLEDYIKEAPARFSIKSTRGRPFNQYILNLGKDPPVQAIINNEYLVGASFTKNMIIAWINNRALHAAPMTLSIVHNGIAKALTDNDDAIALKNDPVPYDAKEKLTLMQTFENLTFTLIIQVAAGIFVVTAADVLQPIKERITGAKDLQIRGGVHPGMYWGSIFLWDFVIYINILIFSLMGIECFNLDGFEHFTDVALLAMIFIIFGIAIFPQNYVLSHIFKEPFLGFVVVLIYNIGSGLVLYFSLLYSYDGNVPWQWQFFAPYAFISALSNLSYISISTHVCQSPDITNAPPELICKSSPVCCKNFDYFSWEAPGISTNLIAMIANGVVFTFLLWIIEYIPQWLTKYGAMAKVKSDHKEIDSEVHAETQRIINMTEIGRMEINLVVDRISKAYPSHVPVRRISFTCDSKECFGLIGPEGAGKTNTLKMLTGNTKITRGVAYVKGQSLKTTSREKYKEFGYCPHYNAFLPDLSGRENLKIFALLRGIPRSHIQLISKELAQIFGFARIMDKEADTYSDDNKRKLSVAIAVLGNPSIIYLDEPTAGLDPDGKRHLWNAVADIREAGKAIVLGSSSMEECKALCTRFAIMVNGELMCIGTMDDLKEKFGQGIIIKVRVNVDTSQHTLYSWMYSKLPPRQTGPSDVKSARVKDSTVEDEKATQVNLQSAAEIKRFILAKFPGSTLIKEYEGRLTFFMPSRSTLRWSQMFGILDRYRRRHYIDHFTISQISLEEVFHNFAKLQTTRNK